jgi:signal peptidase II
MLGEEYAVAGQWFILHFTENPGMAFGMEFGGDYGKIILSLFRIIAAGFGVYYIRNLLHEKAHMGYIVSVALILAGAIGNIIDSMFYGLVFTDSDFRVAEIVSPGNGYAGFLHGKVVDMFYFPIIEGTFPEWFPIWGGEPFEFFRPVFNFADMAISFGVGIIIAFQRVFFPKKNNEVQNSESTNAAKETNETPL